VYLSTAPADWPRPGAPVPEDGDTYEVVTKPWLPIRKEPDGRSKMISLLEHGNRAQLLKWSDDGIWRQVVCPQKRPQSDPLVGWVCIGINQSSGLPMLVPVGKSTIIANESLMRAVGDDAEADYLEAAVEQKKMAMLQEKEASAFASLLKRAAQVVRNADALLITTGAGMGVDSGLGTFRGRNAGVWAPLKALGIDYTAMTRPDWFSKDPRLAWSYWHFSYQLYTKTKPHAGYDLLAKWGSGAQFGLFVVTSNIDGHWAATSDVGSQRVLEIHGAVTHMQCVDSDGRVWPADRSQIEALEVPTWDLEPGESVEVQDHRSEWEDAVVGKDGASIFSSAGLPIRVFGVRRPGGTDILRVAESCKLPECPQSGQLARPNVFMFDDTSWSSIRMEEQNLGFEGWHSSLPQNASLAIIEVGAGKTIPTIRNYSEACMTEFPNATLLRINLDDSDVPDNLADRAISIGAGALDALRQIDAHLRSSTS